MNNYNASSPTAQSLKEFSQLLNTVEEERRRLVSKYVSLFDCFLVLYDLI